MALRLERLPDQKELSSSAERQPRELRVMRAFAHLSD